MQPSSGSFPADAPSANPLFFRSYSRRTADGGRETWDEVVDRNIRGLTRLGKLNDEQVQLLREHQYHLTSLPSGRWLWVGGTEWSSDQRNFYGSYNCSSVEVNHLSAFGLLMNLAMQGTGTGAVLSAANVRQLPLILNRLALNYRGSLGSAPPDKRCAHTMATFSNGGHLEIKVGDSRQGWVDSYQKLLEAACNPLIADGSLDVTIDLSWVRPPGERLKGFGGVANPTALPEMYARVARLLNKATGRRLSPLECCLVIDEAARCVVAGNIRRSAGMRQFDEDDLDAAGAKSGLWVQDAEGRWSIDPERDALRMANHTRMFHHKPSYEEVLDSVRSQHASGEGAIQFTPEALARANADILSQQWLKEGFLEAIEEGGLGAGAQSLSIILFGKPDLHELDHGQRRELEHRMSRFGLNPCGEIIGSDFLCNLAEVHLNRLDPNDTEAVNGAFRAAAITVAALLRHRFRDERMHVARDLDPIVGVSFTGLFDYFVAQLGVEWLQWWAAGRPPHDQGRSFSAHEAKELRRFRQIVEAEVAAFCQEHSLKVPNRCTTVQPAGCLSLDALRVTDMGLLLLDEARDLIACRADPLTLRGGHEVPACVLNEPGPALRLTLVSGRQIVCTPDHRFSLKGLPFWVHASGLKVGDELEANRKSPHTGKPALNLLLGEEMGELEKQPEQLSMALAYVAGVLLGKEATKITMAPLKAASERCLHLAFPATEEAVADRVMDHVSDLFGVKLNRRHAGRTIHIYTRQAALRAWFDLNGLLLRQDGSSDRLPLGLRQAPTSSIRSFFSGLIDATACKLRHQPPTIKITGETLARHLQQVGEAVGLVFRLQSVPDHKTPYWRLVLSRYWSDPAALDYLKLDALHCQGRDMGPTHNCFGHRYFAIASIEAMAVPVATGDISIDTDDDNAWYWAGAIKSHNSKSLLTNASPGWHPPKAPYYIRRITFAKDDPIALACIDYGYTVVPSQSDKDSSGRLLDDPQDSACTEWLVEIPTATPWASLEGAAEVDPGKFSALAQFDFYMQVQQHYSGHNTSATVELTEDEIEPLARSIHAAIDTNQGYISAALLARFDDKETYPRMPFEPITKERYDELCADVLKRRVQDDFLEALSHWDSHAKGGAPQVEGPAGCDSDRCLMPEAKPEG